MKKLLIITHPWLEEKSKLNKTIYYKIKQAGIVDVIHNLYKEYPDFKIDIKKEQKLLQEHDLIIFQHPFFWYSIPPLGHHWMNEVLQYGFAYGQGGDKLLNKNWLSIITTGGSKDEYKSGARRDFTIDEIARPIQQTIKYCGMKWLPLIHIAKDEPDSQGKILTEQQLDQQIEKCINIISSF